MESIPQVIKEAFFLKIPVIATNVGGIPELIEHDRNGLLVDVDQSSQLLDTINGLLDNKEKIERLTDVGYDFVIKNLTWEVLLPKYVKFYEDLLNS